MSYRVVYADRSPDELDIERSVFSRMDVQVIDAESSTRDTVELLEEADGVISSHYTFDRELLERMNQCQIISRRGIGVDYIDLDAAKELGVTVTNVPDYCIPEVSNHSLTLLLSLKRNIVASNAAVKRGEWDPTATSLRRLSGQVLGLVAFGKISQSLAEKANALGMDVLAFDPYLDEELIREKDVTPVDFEELLSRSDVVSLHAPLTEETDGLIGREELQRMKNSALLINTARGGLVDQSAVATALQEGWIEGAGLDVLEEEPPAEDDSLLNCDSVILTPHMAHYSEESWEELRRKSAENVRTVLSGNTPESSVTK